MDQTYRDAIADHGATLISHIGIVDGQGTQVGDRLQVTWTAASDGTVRPDDDLVFDVDDGDEVAGWRGWSAATGGTGYGGADFAAVTFTNPGTFTLDASQTAINHEAG